MLVEVPLSIHVKFNLKPDYVRYPKIENYIAQELRELLDDMYLDFLYEIEGTIKWGIKYQYMLDLRTTLVEHIKFDLTGLKAHINFVGDGNNSEVTTHIKIIYHDDTPVDQRSEFMEWYNETNWNTLSEEDKVKTRLEFIETFKRQFYNAVELSLERLRWDTRMGTQKKPFNESYNPMFHGTADYDFDIMGPEAINAESRTRRRAIQGIAGIPQNAANIVANFAGAPLGTDPEGVPAALSTATLRHPFEYRVAVAEEARAAQAAQALEAAREASAGAAAPPTKKKTWWNPFGGKRRKTRKTRKSSRKTRSRRRPSNA